ncbi:MAG: hypothetical protein RLZZ203_1304 [Cyanobacteriota bacterium]|jgi:hypothetical protein
MPNEYVELSKTPISVFCKHCKTFITDTSTEEELEYLVKFDSETETGREIMIAERNVEKFKEAKNNPLLSNNIKKTFESGEIFDTFISNSEQILNHLKKMQSKY